MNNTEIKNYLIETDLSNNPTGSRLNAFRNALKAIDGNNYSKTKDIISVSKKYTDKVFEKLFYKLPSEEQELIPRKLWSFENLTGYDRIFLKQTLFEYSFELMLSQFKKAHNVLVVLESFRKKPYVDNKAYNFIYDYQDCADFIVISEIGIVPLCPVDYSNLYPFRYFSYIKNDRSKSPLKYNTRKLEKFIEKNDYKYVLFVGQYQGSNQYMHDLYFNVSMDLSVNTDWIWSLNEDRWYEISAKFGAMSGFSYTSTETFKTIFAKKIERIVKYYGAPICSTSS